MDDNSKVEPLTMDVPEAGALLGLGRNAAYEAVKKGVIPVIKIGKRLKVPKAFFHRMIEEGGAK